MNCDICLNSRVIVSENGFHSVCCLPENEMTSCLYSKGDKYIEDPRCVNKKTGEEK